MKVSTNRIEAFQFVFMRNGAREHDSIKRVMAFRKVLHCKLDICTLIVQSLSGTRIALYGDKRIIIPLIIASSGQEDVK
jgi:hypothetical protein